jgi:hypothetical protein
MNVPLSDGTEYKQSFVKHKLPEKNKEPKEKKITDKVPAYDGNFVPMSKDIGANPTVQKTKPRTMCHVSDKEREQMLASSVNRISDSVPPDLRQAILADSG